MFLATSATCPICFLSNTSSRGNAEALWTTLRFDRSPVRRMVVVYVTADKEAESL